MAGNYSRQWASALRQMQRKGAPVVFTLVTAGAETIATGTRGPGTSATVAGYAVRVRGKPLTYQALALIESESPTLEFIPNVYGQLPALNSTAVFGGKSYATADVEPIAPDGVAIGARVIVST